MDVSLMLFFGTFFEKFPVFRLSRPHLMPKNDGVTAAFVGRLNCVDFFGLEIKLVSLKGLDCIAGGCESVHSHQLQLHDGLAASTPDA